MIWLVWLKDPFADHGFLAPGIPEPLAPEALVDHGVNIKRINYDFETLTEQNFEYL